MNSAWPKHAFNSLPSDIGMWNAFESLEFVKGSSSARGLMRNHTTDGACLQACLFRCFWTAVRVTVLHLQIQGRENSCCPRLKSANNIMQDVKFSNLSDLHNH